MSAWETLYVDVDLRETAERHRRYGVYRSTFDGSCVEVLVVLNRLRADRSTAVLRRWDGARWQRVFSLWASQVKSLLEAERLLLSVYLELPSEEGAMAITAKQVAELRKRWP